MKIKTMQDLYIMELQDLHSAETQLIAALPKMMEAATNEELKSAIEEHLEITKTQLERLESIFEELEEEAGGHECAAMKGLVKEGEEVMKEVEEPTVLDAALISAAQRVEHYEMAGYGAAKTYAQLLGYDKHAQLLEESLEEEKEADQILNDLALSDINEEALESSEGDMASSGSSEGGAKKSASAAKSSGTKSGGSSSRATSKSGGSKSGSSSKKGK
jgi:ferritin-like metal-binding protein YciE